MKATARIIPLDLAVVVDQLGGIKAKVAHYKKLEADLVAKLAESGLSEIDGSVFRATVSVADVEKIDWKTIAAKLEPSRQLIAGNTTHDTRTTVRVVARKTS
jgi:hypothetical protein